MDSAWFRRRVLRNIAADILGVVITLAWAGAELLVPAHAAVAGLESSFRSDLECLRHRPSAVLAFWISLPGLSEPVPVSIVPRHGQNLFSAQLYLPPDGEKSLAGVIRSGRLEPYRVCTSGGVLFYERGFCRQGTVREEPSGLKADFTYVPFKVAGRDNPAFAGDLGLLRLEVPAGILLKSPGSLFTAAFGKPVSVQRMPGRDLFPLMKTRFGMPHRLAGGGFTPPIEAFVLPPVHKLSANKHIREPEKKLEADLNDLVALLATDSGLLSQRERIRRQLVPDTVKLNWSRIDDTDIGSGQNQFVFLTLGPGINYFDGPWRKKICALPGPRLIIDPAVVNLADAQIYPSYSIDPPEMGEGRLRAINRFQTGESAPCSSKTSVSCRRDALSMPFERREKVIRELADVLCRYGLLNDDPALERGFSFMGAEFRGNIVNNEIRLRDGLALREWAIGVIVPPGAAKSTRRRLSAIGFTEESGPGGVPLSEFVIEAPFATDAGFRLAYLELVLRRSQPVLSRIIRRLRPDQAPENGIRPGYTSAMHAIDRIIRREGFAFLFHRRSFDASRSWAEWRTAWSEWLEALIRGDDGAACERLRCRVGSLRSKLFCEGLPEDRQDHAQVNR